MSSQTGGINRKALMSTVGIGLVIIFLVFLINALPIGFEGPHDVSPVFLICSSCLSVLGFLAIGALYASNAQRTEASIDIGRMALGGALTALIVAITLSICRSCLLFATASTFEVGGLLNNSVDINADNTVQILAFSSVILCITIVFYTILGAAGAALNAMRLRNRPKAEPTPSEPPAPQPPAPQPPSADRPTT